MTQDHLGSPRIITDNTGKVIARKDFNAFGDETNSTQRTEQLGYKPEEIRQDYTGYQKDDESGLEFAQARYYNGKHGRFTSVDPLVASANVKDPQTFNRYSYALNSPYKFTDPLGLLSVHTGACGQCSTVEKGGGGAFDSAGNGSGFSEDVETEQTAVTPEPPPSPLHSERSSGKVVIQSKIESVKIYNGEKVVLPTGDTANKLVKGPDGKLVEVPIAGYGALAITSIQIEVDGELVDPNSEGYKLEESIAAGKATPKGAEQSITISTSVPVDAYPDGKFYDIQGSLQNTLSDYKAVGEFSIEKIQTLTLTDSSGKILATRINSIVLTNKTVTLTDITPTKEVVPKPKKP